MKKILFAIFLILVCSVFAFGAENEMPTEIKKRILAIKESILTKNIDALYNNLEDGVLEVLNGNYGAVKYSREATEARIKSKKVLKDKFNYVFNDDFKKAIATLEIKDVKYKNSYWADYWEWEKGPARLINDERYGGKLFVGPPFKIIFDAGDGKLLMVYNSTAIIPSFDCNKASTRAEKLICQDKSLADKDRELSRRYFYTRSVLTGLEAKQLKSNQLAFLKKRDYLITNNDKDSELKELILRSMNNRRKELDDLIENETKKPVLLVPLKDALELIQGKWSTTGFMDASNISSASYDDYRESFAKSPFSVILNNDKIIVTKETKQRVLENTKDDPLWDFNPENDTVCKIVEAFHLPLAKWFDMEGNHPMELYGSGGGSIGKFDMLPDVYIYKLKKDCNLFDSCSYFIYTQNHREEGKAYLPIMSDLEETNGNDVSLNKLLPSEVFLLKRNSEN